MAFTYGRGGHTDSHLINITILLGVVVLIKKENCQWNDKYDLNHEHKLCEDALGDHVCKFWLNSGQRCQKKSNGSCDFWTDGLMPRHHMSSPVMAGWANNLVHIFISLHLWVKCTNIAYLCFFLLLIITFGCFTGMSVHKLSVSIMYKWCSCRWV